MRDIGSIPGLGRYPGGGVLAWRIPQRSQAGTVHRVAKSRTGLKQLSMPAQNKLMKDVPILLLAGDKQSYMYIHILPHIYSGGMVPNNHGITLHKYIF